MSVLLDKGTRGEGVRNLDAEEGAPKLPRPSRRRWLQPGVDLSGRRVLVTGSSSGIGEAAVRQFAAAGAHVILVSDHAANLSRVLDGILATGAWAMAAITDLTKQDQIEGLLERLESQVGPIDTRVNNAGAGLGATILDTRLEDMRFVFEVNFFAV